MSGAAAIERVKKLEKRVVALEFLVWTLVFVVSILFAVMARHIG